MTPFESVLYAVGTVELIGIAVVVNLFVVLYSFRNWRSNAYGRALMYSKLSLVALVDLSLTTALFGPEWPGRELVRVLLFGAILASQTRLLVLLIKLGKIKNRRSQLHKDLHRMIKEAEKDV